MYQLADKYDVVGLKDLVQEKFKRSCANSWDEEAFAVAATHAFTTTIAKDKGLGDIVTSAISAHMGLIQKPEVQALMTEFNGLALGILLKRAAEHG
jgi:hypothetical protein